jgi:hypothetical protein
MAIIVNCPCGRKLKIQDEFAGQEGTCPACNRVLQIPPREDDLPVVERVEPPTLEAADEEINNHAGDPIPGDADFFVDPPQEIGPLLSAYTTLRQGKRPWPMWLRVFLSLCFGFLGLLIGGAIDLCAGVKSPFWLVVWPLVGLAVGILSGVVVSSFTHTCTYVGRDGVAHFVCSGRRDNITTNEVFCFRDATDLRTSQTRHYKNGVYQHTAYSYTWTDVGGRKRFQITGNHKNEAGNPPTTDHYQFARATEIAWTMYLMDQVQRELQLSGGVKFQLGKSNWIRVGQGKLTFVLRGAEEEWDAQEVGGVIVDNGVVKIKRTDAQEGWFSSSGVVKFSFDTLGNAQLFFHLLDKLIGVRAQ